MLIPLSSLAKEICIFFSGNKGDGTDFGVLDDVGVGDEARSGIGAKDIGGGARAIGGRRAFSAASCAAAEWSVKV